MEFEPGGGAQRIRDRQRFKNELLLQTAELWATASHAKRLKVGCVIALNNRILSTGYNGTPAGTDNTCEDANGTTLPVVAHAEQNAITYCAKYGIPTRGSYIYVNHSPCMECAKLIVSAGIQRVYFRTLYRLTDGVNFLNESGLKTFRLETANLKEVIIV